MLASHAGFFIRKAELTGDAYFAVLARSAIWGRDAFLNRDNKVASYYWASMDAGAGKFPHHAWWQIGLLTDYLISENSYRSHGRIVFWTGFFTPKVGPHKTFGFQSGKVFGKSADLMLRKDIISGGSPYLDFLVAFNEDDNKVFVFLLNNSAKAIDEKISLQLNADFGAREIEYIQLFYQNGIKEIFQFKEEFHWINLPPSSLKIIEITLTP